MNSKSFVKILWTELLNITNPINFIPIILIPIVLSFVNTTQSSLSNTLWYQFANLCTIIFLWKVLSDIFLPKNVDKNIVIFLNNNKHIAFLSKTIANIIIFIIPLLLYIGLSGIIIIINGGTWGSSTPTALRVFTFSIAIIVLYVFITLFIDFILSLSINKLINNAILILVLLIILLFYYILPLIFSSMETSTGDRSFLDIFFLENNPDSNKSLQYKEWVLYTPFFNITPLYMQYFRHSISHSMSSSGTSTSAILSDTQINILSPLIFETIIMIGIIWIPMTRKTKVYLCT